MRNKKYILLTINRNQGVYKGMQKILLMNKGVYTLRSVQYTYG